MEQQHPHQRSPVVNNCLQRLFLSIN